MPPSPGNPSSPTSSTSTSPTNNYTNKNTTPAVLISTTTTPTLTTITSTPTGQVGGHLHSGEGDRKKSWDVNHSNHKQRTGSRNNNPSPSIASMTPSAV